MTRAAILAVLAAVAAFSLHARAQGAPDQQQKIAAIKQKIAENQMALRKYQWLQTTKMSVNGEVKNTIVKSCSYSAGPKPVCTVISSTPAEKPSGGPLKKKMIENKIAEMKAYMDSVKTLMEMYVPPSGERIQAAAQTGNVAVAPNPSQGTDKVVISNYAQQGDAMTLLLGAQNHNLRSLTVSTYLSVPTSVVTLRVTFAALPDGTRYAQRQDARRDGAGDHRDDDQRAVLARAGRAVDSADRSRPPAQGMAMMKRSQRARVRARVGARRRRVRGAAAGAAADAQQKVAEFKQLLAANQQARRAFTWLETTQIAYQGVVKTTKLSDCQYSGPSPKPVCTELSLQQAPLSGGFIRKRIEEKKQAETEGVHGQRADAAGRVRAAEPGADREGVPDRERAVLAGSRGGDRPADRHELPAEGRHRDDHLERRDEEADVGAARARGSAARAAPVQVAVQFNLLPNGVFYAYRKTLNVPAKSMSVTVTASDFSEAIKP